MANINGSASWDDIYQIEDTDLVKGGADGTANTQAQAIANRLEFLKSFLGAAGGIINISTNTTGGSVQDNTLLDLFSILKFTAKCVYTLPVNANIPIGTYVQFIAALSGAQYGTIKQATGNLLNGSATIAQIYLYEGEKAELVFNGTNWEVIRYNGNLFNAGEELSGRSQITGTLIKQGQVLNRTDYPRLFAYIQSLTSGVTSESLWLSSLQYQGFFTLGNGSSTFRIPDDRGMFDRYMDLGRGIDYSRGVNSAWSGSYEADAVMSHSHTMRLSRVSNGGSGQDAAWMNPGSFGRPVGTWQTENTGSTENLVKNLSKFPLIKY